MKKWVLKKNELMYDGYRKIERRHFEMPDGVVREFDIVLVGESICALVITEEGKVVLARQFRPAPGIIMAELPGGGLEEGESPLEAIRREVLEETGYSGTITGVGTAYKDAYTTYKVHSFLITEAKQVAEPENNPSEPIEVVHMDIEQFKAHLTRGELTDITTAHQALQYYERGA